VLFRSDIGYYGPHRIRVHGSLNLDGTKITSWNYDTGNYSTQNTEGSIPRPYIIIEPRADISLLTDTEIAFMGYNGAGKQGLSMYGGDGTILEGNIIHDLWLGLFSDNLGNLTIQNNTIYQNIKYGVYPRTGIGSVIENNHIIDNNVGLTCSQGCHEMLIRNNEIHNNKVAGVVFSRNVSDSIAINNNVSNSGIGIAASESYANDISGNIVSNNRVGLQLKGGSFNNILNNNTVANTSECGILVTGNAKDNAILHNGVYDSAKNGICLSQGSESNRFSSNLIDSPGNFGISVKDRDSEGNVFENNIIRLAENGIAVQNNTKTTFVNTILHEIEDIQYIVSTNSTLNLEKNPPTSSIIRSTGTSYNMISIKDSGSITLISSSQDDESGQELFTSSVHNSDNSPYTRRLSPGAIIELDSRPY
jgi:parallel beta-helix repeat protein